MSDSQEVVSSNQGSGQSVSIVIPAESVRPLSFLGLACILAVSLSLLAVYISDHSSDAAALKADAARQAAIDAKTEARLSQYYSIDLETYLAKSGLNPPPDPWRKKSKEKSK